MKQINLYQAEFHPPRVILPVRHLVPIVVLALAVLVGMVAVANWRLHQVKTELEQIRHQDEEVEQQLAAIGTEKGQADAKLLAQISATEAKVHALSLAQDAIKGGELGSREGYSGQFRALARASVAGIWLTRVEVTDQGHAVDLFGRSLQGEAHARLLNALRREPLFVGLSYERLGVQPGEGAMMSQSEQPVAPRFLEFALTTRLDGKPVKATP